MPKPCPERTAALAAGQAFYFTGKPCSRGHVSKRYVGTSVCAKCASEASTRWAAKTPWHPLRAAARANGEVRYNTGEPCANGHSADRYTSNGFCVVCDAAKNKRYHVERPGLSAAWKKIQRAKDPTKHRAASRKWANANKEWIVAALKRWKAANPERAKELARVGANNRRTRRVANGGRFTRHDIENLYAWQNGRCAVCPCREKLEIDHVHPIFLGGSSDPSNLQLLCRSCNRSKKHKTTEQWLLGVR